MRQIAQHLLVMQSFLYWAIGLSLDVFILHILPHQFLSVRSMHIFLVVVFVCLFFQSKLLHFTALFFSNFLVMVCLLAFIGFYFFIIF